MRHLLTCLCLVACTACGQNQNPPVQPGRSATPDIPLAAQIEAVRTGGAIEIRVSTKFTRQDLVPILALKNLVRLNLSETDLTDDDVEQIAALPKLETLRIDSLQMTDTSMAHLARSKTLRHLILLDVPITDAGLLHLADCESLESLYLINTRVTEDGYSALMRQRPTLHVH